MGIRASEIEKTFVFDPKEDKKKFETIISMFDSHFLPHKNIIHERYVFYKRDQQHNEPVDEFITALHTLSEMCEFGFTRDEMIRDRIVVGIVDAELSKIFQLTLKLTFHKTIEMVRIYKDVLQPHPTSIA